MNQLIERPWPKLQSLIPLQQGNPLCTQPISNIFWTDMAGNDARRNFWFYHLIICFDNYWYEV